MAPVAVRIAGEKFARLWTSARTLGSRIRSTTDARIFALEVYTAVYSFTAAAFHTDKPVIAEDPLALVKLALPVFTVVTVLLLRNAWAGNRERRQLAPVIDVTLAFGLVILLQMALSAYLPDLALPRWRTTQGGWAGWLFLTELRTMFPPHSRLSRQSPGVETQLMYTEEIRWRAEELQRQLRRRNTWVWCVAAAILILFSVRFASTNAIAPRIGSALIMSGALFITLQVWRMGTPRVLGADSNFEVFREFCRSELDRQGKMLRLILYSYISLLIPGLLLVLAGAVVYAYVIVMYVFLAAELLYREMFHLQQEHNEITFASAVPAAG